MCDTAAVDAVRLSVQNFIMSSEEKLQHMIEITGLEPARCSAGASTHPALRSLRSDMMSALLLLPPSGFSLVPCIQRSLFAAAEQKNWNCLVLDKTEKISSSVCIHLPTVLFGSSTL